MKTNAWLKSNMILKEVKAVITPALFPLGVYRVCEQAKGYGSQQGLRLRRTSWHRLDYQEHSTVTRKRRLISTVWPWLRVTPPRVSHAPAAAQLDCV